MTGSKEQFMEMREAQELTPEFIPQISKTNAKIFHDQVKQRVKDSGNGLFEYMEFIKFVEKLQKIISGDQYTPGDDELKNMIREEISKYGKEMTSPRGVKFELAETGTRYDFSKCNDDDLFSWETELELLSARIKARKEMLKTIPTKGIDLAMESTAEVVTVYPPSKSSTSSFKVTLPK